MYKVYIEDIYQIEDILDFYGYHNYDFTDKDGMFAHTFSTKEEADKFIQEEPLLNLEDPEWIPFVVHIENDKVIDINGQPFPQEIKRYLALFNDGSILSYDTLEEFHHLYNLYTYLDTDQDYFA